MSEIFPDNGTIRMCEGIVRWIDPPTTIGRRLEQKYSVATFKDGAMIESHVEWIEVETVQEGWQIE